MKKSYKAIVYLILVGAGCGMVWHYRGDLSVLLNRNVAQLSQQVAENLNSSSTVATINSLKNKILAPEPLISSRSSKSAYLTVAGVISQTNLQRQENGNLAALKENSRLDQAAAAKLADMFKQQYFEHESPQGKGPGDLAAAAGYAYIMVGENLAMGNFDSDAVLVQDWMDSPGHRANILNVKYQEIGVAVGQGTYQGKKIWMAVQEFGRPESSCPEVNSALKTQIDNLQSEIDSTSAQMAQLKQYLDSVQPSGRDETDAYNQQVADYNNLVKIYNNKVDTLKLTVAEYNAEVNAYNECLN